jgi:uncharacterized protein (DUF305 family)
MRKRSAVATALGLLIVLGSACSSADDGTSEATDESTTPAVAGHNDADVTFAQSMIPHHEQAVEMAQLATDRASSEAVRALAAEIEAAQSPEIEQMTGWLAEWGEDDSMGAMPDMESGMMSDAQMGELEAASGEEFDRMFLEMMIEHHTGAIAMAETEITDGQYAEAIALAEQVKSAQEAEITEMETLLDQL